MSSVLYVLVVALHVALIVAGSCTPLRMLVAKDTPTVAAELKRAEQIEAARAALIERGIDLSCFASPAYIDDINFPTVRFELRNGKAHCECGETYCDRVEVDSSGVYIRPDPLVYDSHWSGRDRVSEAIRYLFNGGYLDPECYGRVDFDTIGTDELFFVRSPNEPRCLFYWDYDPRYGEYCDGLTVKMLNGVPVGVGRVRLFYP